MSKILPPTTLTFKLQIKYILPSHLLCLLSHIMMMINVIIIGFDGGRRAQKFLVFYPSDNKENLNDYTYSQMGEY